MPWIVALITLLYCLPAYADDARCGVPPYGGTDERFKTYVKVFGFLGPSAKILSAVCNAKYSEQPGGTRRTALYNLGFTDKDIDEKDTEQLAADMIAALKNVVDKLPPR